MSARNRDDLICLSLGPANVALLKDTAAREGLPVSALVREWVATLADNEGAKDGS